MKQCSTLSKILAYKGLFFGFVTTVMEFRVPYLHGMSSSVFHLLSPE